MAAWKKFGNWMARWEPYYMIIRRHGWAILAAQEYEITTFHRSFMRAISGINIKVYVANKLGTMPSPGFPFLDDGPSGNGMRRLGEGSENGENSSF